MKTIIYKKEWKMSSNSNEPGVGCYIMWWTFCLIVFIVVSMIFGWTNPPAATKTLKALGYTNITTTGYRWFDGTGDWYHTGFEANSPTGERVSGCVSSGLIFKGNTVRLD